MRSVKGKLLWVILAAALLGGCTDDQLRQVDDLAADVNSVGTAIGELPDGPAGPLIPPGVANMLKLTGIAIGAAYGGWQTFRRKQTEGALASVTKGVERQPPEIKANLKGDIKAAMIETGKYAQQNAIIDKVKN